MKLTQTGAIDGAGGPPNNTLRVPVLKKKKDKDKEEEDGYEFNWI